MTIKTSDLKSALESLRRVKTGRAFLPILSCVRLHTERNRLHLAATSLDEYIIERVEGEGEIAPLCVSLNGLSLAVLGGEETIITKNDKKILVKCGSSESWLPALDAEEFPTAPKMEKSEAHGCACDELAALVSSVSFAACADETRYVLKSVKIEGEAKKLTAVASNGRELAIATAALIGSKFDLVVPVEFVANFAAALSRKGSILSSNANIICVSHDWGSYTCKQVDGVYPNYRQVIPASMKNIGAVNVAEMKSAASGCLGYDIKGEAKAKLTFSKSGLVIESLGAGGENLIRQVSGTFEPLVVALSLKKLSLIFSHLKTETADLSAVDELTPLKIESGSLTVITMPMRL